MDKNTHRESDISADRRQESPPTISDLIAELSDKHAVTRRRAREKLVALGGPAVELLLELLTHHKAHLRWEAAKALGGIGDPRSADHLVGALENDEDKDVRWLAAEGLIAMGWHGLRPLLAALADRPGSVTLREGAHRVCHNLGKRKAYKAVLPVLAALDEPDPELAVPSVARVASDKLAIVFGMTGRTGTLPAAGAIGDAGLDV